MIDENWTAEESAEAAVDDLYSAAEALHHAADSSPSPERASVLRRAAADVAVIAERVRSK